MSLQENANNKLYSLQRIQKLYQRANLETDEPEFKEDMALLSELIQEAEENVADPHGYRFRDE